MVNRKEFLKISGLIGAAALLPACRNTEKAEPASDVNSTCIPNPTPQLPSTPTETNATLPATPSASVVETPLPDLAVRIAHITDMHIPQDGTGQKEFSKILSDVRSLTPPVDFVFNTGDCIFDSLQTDKDTAIAEWDAFQSILTPDFPIPVYHAIGNHDVWGWGLPEEERATQQHDPAYGKGMALQKLGLSNGYYSFDKGGWHFVILDDTYPEDKPSDHPYTGKLDDEQYSWLVADLTATNETSPICIVSHIPIFGACNLLDSDESSGNWVMPGAWQHIDGRRLIDLFWQHRNIKLCLCGHTHMVEDLRFQGVKYLTNGSVSGNWWNGPYHNFPYGFAVLNLYHNGSSDCEIITI